MYHFALLRNIILPLCFWGRMWNVVKPSSLCQGCHIVVSWRKCTSWPRYVKISIYEHLVDTGRLRQLNSLNNLFVLKELLALAVPQIDWAGSSGGTQRWRRLLPASSPGGTGLLSPCWEQGEPLLYVLALACIHPGCRRLETAMPGHRRNREGWMLQELENEGRQRGWDTGHGKESSGQKWKYYGTASSPAARLYNLKWLTWYRNIKVVIWD